jgi:hypothetical protein
VYKFLNELSITESISLLDRDSFKPMLEHVFKRLISQITSLEAEHFKDK